MIQPILVNGGLASASSTWYHHIFGGLQGGTVEAEHATAWPVSGTFKSMTVRLDAAPGTGKSMSFTLRINGADTGLTFTISDAATTGTITTDGAVTAGQTVALKTVPSGTPPTLTPWDIAYEFEPTDDTSTAYGHHDGISFAGGGFTLQFRPLWYGANAAGNTNEATNVMPCAGTLDTIYVQASGNPGASAGLTYHVYLNGVKQDGTGGTVDTGVVATGAQSQWSRASVGLSWSAGDRLYIQAVIATSGTGSRQFMHTFAITPTVAGQSMIGAAMVNASASTGVTRYNAPYDAASTAQSTEATTAHVRPQLAVTLSNFYVWHSAAMGSGAQREYTLRRASNADTAQVVTIAGTSEVLDSDTTNSVDVAADEAINVKMVNAVSAITPHITAWAWVIEPTSIDIELDPDTAVATWVVPTAVPDIIVGNAPTEPPEEDTLTTGYIEFGLGGSMRSWLRGRE